MKVLMMSLVFLFAMIACSPASQQNDENEQESEQEYILDDDLIEDGENVKDDSLKNRDMLSLIYS